MTAAAILIAASAAITLVLGTLHLVFTFSGERFFPRDASLIDKMKEVSPRISPQTTIWRAGVGHDLARQALLVQRSISRHRRNAATFSKPTTNTKLEDSAMTTAIIFHEVQDGAVWAKAWKQGPGSRHEMFGKLGIKCRNFRDPKNPNATGVMAEIPDMAKFQELLRSDEGQKAMREDGLKVETMRVLIEFTP